MWRNYLTVSVRALAKSRTYSIINIAGLAIGMAACLLILLFIRYEKSYDSWVPDAANTYQFQAWYEHPSDGEPFFLQMSSYVTQGRMRKDFPQIEHSVYVLSSAPVVTKDGQVSPTENYKIVDDDFLAVVNLPLVRGSRAALAHNDTAVLTQSEARKRFGTEDVVGKTLSIITKGVTRDFQITGVLKDMPRNSHMKIDAILRLDFAAYMDKEPQFLTCWGCQSGFVYFKLRPGTDPKSIEAGLPAWEKRNISDENNGDIHFNQGEQQDWHLIRLPDIHLGKGQDGAMTPGNDQRSIATFAIIALLILGMAIVNFTNLATARASQRAREVALRKVLGASRRQLISQFLGESLLMAAVAMLLAMTLVELVLPLFARFLEADLSLHYFGAGGMILPILLLVVGVGLAGGLYPAFFLSRFQPASVLKANRSAAETPGSGRLRSALVVGQFAVSIGLIICTAVIYGQTLYARSVDPGYKRDHIIQVDNLSRYQLIDKGDAIVEQMRRIPDVVAVGRTAIGVATTNNSNTGLIPPGSSKQITIGQYYVDPGFLDAMGLTLKAGRWFDKARPLDDATLPFPADPTAEKALATRGLNVVINELGAKKLGFQSPADAVGKTVKGEIFSPEAGPVAVTIIGVVGDARFRSVRTPLEPIMFLSGSTGQTYMIVRYRGDPAAMRAKLESAWKTITRDVPFEAKYSEDIIAELYKAEDARAQLFAIFSVLAVIIGCLGLFGLAAFTAERRTKEIGIRKVLGARTRDIVQLLVWQFSRPVVLANIIAWPIAWWVMRDWLNGFDDRIALTPVPFLIAATIALIIAVATVAGHALRIARANPIHALRYE